MAKSKKVAKTSKPAPKTKAQPATLFDQRLKTVVAQHAALLARKNTIDKSWNNGVYDRYTYPVLTAAHTPLFWRYDLDKRTNPYLMERLGMNAAFNCGAIQFNGKYVLMVRAEGVDRKSFFAVAESSDPVQGFQFWNYPVAMPQTDDPDINVYDMRLVKHEDGWIYGLFCTERKDPAAPIGDTSSATAQCGIARTKDLVKWDRLADLDSTSSQQRNVVLHPEFIDGKYAFYTRPQDSFIDAGKGGGVGWALSGSIEHSKIDDEKIIEPKLYHTIKEVKNGMGAAPVKTAKGWLHVAHGVRNTAAGLRYVLYVFLCDLHDPSTVIARPGGYFIAPRGHERVGDVSNVVFCNGLITRDDGQMFIYYASSDTRIHVAVTSVDKMLDYALSTPPDPMRSDACVAQRSELIRRNLAMIERSTDKMLRKARM